MRINVVFPFVRALSFLLYAYEVHSHGIFAGPLTSSRLVLGAVLLEDIGDIGHKRIIGVGISQQGTDGEEHLGDGECG